MIDYTKLQRAHELAAKLSWYTTWQHQVYINNQTSKLENVFHASIYLAEDIASFDNIDEFLAKLEELTKPESKYLYKQVVWRKSDNGDDCTEFCIDVVGNFCDGIQSYADKDGRWWPEDCVYPTKSALIEAMIAHWESMRDEPKCNHKNCKSLGESHRVSCYQLNAVQKNDNLSECPPFEGEVKGFKPECDHEPQLDFVHPGYPGFKKGYIQLCIKCHEEYVPNKPKDFIFKCDHGLATTTFSLRRLCPDCGEYAWFAEDRS